MRKQRTVALLVMIVFILLLGYVALYAQIIPDSWTEKLIYLKDERTKACYVIRESGNSNYGPYFSYVPCELVEKADWFAYEKKRQR